GQLGAVLVVVDVEVGSFLGRGELVEVLEVGGDGLHATRAVHPAAERFAGFTLGAEPADHTHGSLGGVLGREAKRPFAEVGLGFADVAAEQHGVAGGRLAVGATFGAGEPDVGDVVLTRGVGAARVVGSHPPRLGQALFFEPSADGVGQAPGLRHRQVAGVGAGAGDHVSGELGAGLSHADGL